MTTDAEEQTAGPPRLEGSGFSYRKCCTSCQQYRALQGGSFRGKLRLWRCRQCTLKSSGVVARVDAGSAAKDGSDE